MNLKKSCFKTIFFISIYVLCHTATVLAASGTNFSVREIIPENQLDKNVAYFDLRLAPKEKQTIQMIIENSEEEDIIAHVILNAASTGRDGLIAYLQPEVRDESLSISIKDIAKVVNPELKIPAKGSATVNIEIQMPDQSFNGVILGGLVTTARKNSENQANAEESTALNNEFAYVTGLKITENDHEIVPDFELVSVTPGLVNYHSAVTISLRNKMPLIVKGMEVSAKIYENNSQDVLRELNLDYAEMAPNSIGDFAVDWESNAIAAGTYRLEMTVKYQGKEWTWDESFTISQTEAKETNENAVNLITKPVWPYITILILVLSIIILIGILMRRRGEAKVG